MKGSNLLKTYLKHFILAFNLLQWIFSWIIFEKLSYTNSFYSAIIFALMGLVLYLFFLVITEKLKQVFFEDNFIIIPEIKGTDRISVTSIKSIQELPFLPFYRILLKNKKRSLYTLVVKNNEDIVKSLQHQIKLAQAKERNLGGQSIPSYKQVSV